MRTAYLIVRDVPLAEDVVEDAFLRAYERICQFDAKRPFEAWFLRIVVHIAQRRAAQRERLVSLDGTKAHGETALDELLADIQADPEESAEQADLRDALWAALENLTPAQRAAIVQRYYWGLSEREIAIGLNCPLGTIKWWLHVARKRLREWLRPGWKTETRDGELTAQVIK
jgi:RNA polymerase sigma-70 factor (ECF subfamily)